jgi:hypothetical protein
MNNIGFNKINSDFTGAANRVAIRQLLTGIGSTITSIIIAHKDSKLLAEGLLQLIRAITEGDGKSSQRSSHEDLIIINPENLFLSFNTLL